MSPYAPTRNKPLDSEESLLARYAALNTWLRTHVHLYGSRPFTQPSLDWEERYPRLSQACRSLSIEAIRQYEQTPAAWSDAPHEFLRLAREEDALTSGIRSTAAPPKSRLPRHIPARKWRQIQYFAAAIGQRITPGNRLVDWCAGKGHLGRTLAMQHGSEVLCLERQAPLCRAAMELAEQLSVPLHSMECDVLTTVPLLKPHDQVVGLHACGQLTDRLLTTARTRGVRLAAVASCCYHATVDGEYYPQSHAAQTSDRAPISRHSLRLMTADETVARPAIRMRREREHVYRLGLDLLVREATGRDEYQPLPPLKPAVLNLNFHEFCRQVSNQYALPLPPHYCPEKAEAAGAERSRVARSLGLVRALFRRPLELLVVLDRAIACTESGRRVELVEFCPRTITPRNLLIISEA